MASASPALSASKNLSTSCLFAVNVSIACAFTPKPGARSAVGDDSRRLVAMANLRTGGLECSGRSPDGRAHATRDQWNGNPPDLREVKTSPGRCGIAGAKANHPLSSRVLAERDH